MEAGQKRVLLFMDTFGKKHWSLSDFLTNKGISNEERRKAVALAGSLIYEEVSTELLANVKRLLDNLYRHDYVPSEELIEAIYDDIIDSKYVLDFLANTIGFDLEPGEKEVHRANMSKLFPDGKPRYREDGKVVKPEGWIRPTLLPILKAQLKPPVPWQSRFSIALTRLGHYTRLDGNVHLLMQGTQLPQLAKVPDAILDLVLEMKAAIAQAREEEQKRKEGNVG